MHKPYRIQENSKTRQPFMNLPKRILEGMAWKKGDKIRVEISGKNRLELVKMGNTEENRINLYI